MWTVDSPVQSCGEEGRARTEPVGKRYKEAPGVGLAGVEEFDCITHPPPPLAPSFRAPNAVAPLARCI
ncbi:hypothetical protein NL676_016493 [Syzygium grande]|nr:hypothetical protein NL676_016493 [Syzygium grande]